MGLIERPVLREFAPFLERKDIGSISLKRTSLSQLQLTLMIAPFAGECKPEQSDLCSEIRIPQLLGQNIAVWPKSGPAHAANQSDSDAVASRPGSSIEALDLSPPAPRGQVQSRATFSP